MSTNPRRLWIWRTSVQGGAVDQAPDCVRPSNCQHAATSWKILDLSLWLGVALYAAIGLFGVIIF